MKTKQISKTIVVWSCKYSYEPRPYKITLTNKLTRIYSAYNEFGEIVTLTSDDFYITRKACVHSIIRDKLAVIKALRTQIAYVRKEIIELNRNANAKVKPKFQDD